LFRLLHFIVVNKNGVRVMVFNAIFNNISVISWRLVKMHVPVDVNEHETLSNITHIDTSKIKATTLIYLF
jgi:hypothetical protein